ncbi:MAG: hypothetical protein JW847_00015 [Candidatus Omnitrophica bacterium]|nr:hypothetical protein [Candidatus Omnitrophota bacterium]
MRRVENGYVLKVVDQDGNAGEPKEIVYQEKYEDEVECFADFLRYLDEHYGPSTSRYSEKRIYIRVEPGDKCESP